MELPKDPVMLLSVINTELRDKYPSLDALCEDREITKTSITDTLKGIDYEYDNIRNQFVCHNLWVSDECARFGKITWNST